MRQRREADRVARLAGRAELGRGSPTGDGSETVAAHLLDPTGAARRRLGRRARRAARASVVVAVTIGRPASHRPTCARASPRTSGLGEPTLTPAARRHRVGAAHARVLTAAAVGAGLALCGAVMQALTRNPLADPYLLGLSSGASRRRGRRDRARRRPAAAGRGVRRRARSPSSRRSRSPRARRAAPRRPTPHGARRPRGLAAVRRGHEPRHLLERDAATATARSSTGCSARSPAPTGRRSRSRAAPSSSSASRCSRAPARSTPSRSATPPRRPSACTSAAAAALLLVGTALLTGALVAVSGAIGFVGLILPHAVRLLVGPGHRRAAAARRRWPARSSWSGPTPSRARCSTRASCPSASSPPSSAARSSPCCCCGTEGSMTGTRPRPSSTGVRFGAAAAHHRRRRLHRARRARSARCSARTAPARRTLLHLIAGVERADAGTRVLGEPRLAAHAPPRARARSIALAEQEVDGRPGPDGRARSSPSGAPRTSAPSPDPASAIAPSSRALLEDARRSIDLADRDYGSLSGGERQRVQPRPRPRAGARAAAARRADEPPRRARAADDARPRRELAHGGLTVLAALHDLSLAAAYADHVIVLADGRVVAAGDPPTC